MALKLNREATVTTVTIASGGTTSDAFVVGGYSFGGVITPAALTSTALSFSVCGSHGGTYVPLTDTAGATISVTVAASKAVALPPELFGFAYAKVVGGSSEGADRVLTITLKG